VREALIAPFDLAALVLCAAGVAKLRSPRPAARALIAAGLPPRLPLVAAGIRLFEFGELLLGLICLAAPARPTAILLACVYGMFVVLALLLARRQTACGCFGESDAPASSIQALLSGVLCGLAIVAVASPPRDVGWVLGHGAVEVTVCAVALLAAAYATVLAYTELPRAWATWSPQ
jgi:uncharacterized membrane protein YedE/YeeE